MSVPSTVSRITVPNFVKDPVWSLHPWDLSVRVAGRDFTIPAMAAHEWLAILMPDDLDPDDVFPGLVDGDPESVREYLFQAMMDGIVTHETVERVAFDVIEAVSGRPWWIALRLIGLASQNWSVLGVEMLTAVDVAKMSLSGWLDVLFVRMLQQFDESHVAMFLSRLELPPEDHRSDAAEPEMAEDAFMAMAM